MTNSKIFGAGFLFVACIAMLHGPAGYSQNGQPDGQCCSIVEQALRTIDHIKKGQTRANIEKDFMPDGGADFRTETIYVFRLCPLIKVRIKFTAIGTNVTQSAVERMKDSPRDLVEEIGQPYIQYPVKD